MTLNERYEEVRMSEKMDCIYMYNELDEEFGCNPGAKVFMYGLEPL